MGSLKPGVPRRAAPAVFLGGGRRGRPGPGRGGVVLATRAGRPRPSPAPGTRLDPSRRPRGLGPLWARTGQPLPDTPDRAAAELRSPRGRPHEAYPSQVAADFGLTMTVRTTNCHLTGDQLSISGAVADGIDNTTRDGQCPVPPQQARNLADELAAADLVRHPARWSCSRTGRTTSTSAPVSNTSSPASSGVGIGLGNSCVANGSVTPASGGRLADVRASLARRSRPWRRTLATIAVLDYYQPIPEPSQIADGTPPRAAAHNLVCSGLKPNAASTFAAAQIVLGALQPCHGRRGGRRPRPARHERTLVNVATAFDGHGICTADPLVFSGEPVPDATLASDAATSWPPRPAPAPTPSTARWPARR